MSHAVSSHIERQRWVQRSDDPVMDPVDAWTHGYPLRNHGLDRAEEVRYHPHTETVLLSDGETLITVLDADQATWPLSQAIAYRRDQL